MCSLTQAIDPWSRFQFALIAAIRNVSHSYFSILRSTGDRTWCERPYCYELYHQLRCQFGVRDEYTLHGELDKRYGAEMRAVFGGTIPDFVVHIPGTMRNLVVIEVKNAQSSSRLIKRDLMKLESLCVNANYVKGVMLVFGSGSRWSQQLDLTDGAVTVLQHEQVGCAPKVLTNASEWTLPVVSDQH